MDADDDDPTIYSRFFRHLLQHRNCRILRVDRLCPDVGSAHDLDVVTHELMASPDEVADLLATVEVVWSADEIVRSVEAWHRV